MAAVVVVVVVVVGAVSAPVSALRRQLLDGADAGTAVGIAVGTAGSILVESWRVVGRPDLSAIVPKQRA